MAAALVLGADAVWCGSCFLASKEAEAHDAYKDRVLSADVGDTAIVSIYGPEWPGQTMRAIINDGARVALGREAEAIRDAEGQIIGSTVLNGRTIPVPRYSAILPTRDFDGNIEQACLTAGQSAGNIEEILSAGEIVRRMTSEAKAALDGLAAMRKAA
jgi:NAD(P)H-dependent flavin oxidoreductase YrpB (nitropropane dioxygenase family)